MSQRKPELRSNVKVAFGDAVSAMSLAVPEQVTGAATNPPILQRRAEQRRRVRPLRPRPRGRPVEQAPDRLVQPLAEDESADVAVDVERQREVDVVKVDTGRAVRRADVAPHRVAAVAQRRTGRRARHRRAVRMDGQRLRADRDPRSSDWAPSRSVEGDAGS